ADGAGELPGGQGDVRRRLAVAVQNRGDQAGAAGPPRRTLAELGADLGGERQLVGHDGTPGDRTGWPRAPCTRDLRHSTRSPPAGHGPGRIPPPALGSRGRDASPLAPDAQLRPPKRVVTEPSSKTSRIARANSGAIDRTVSLSSCFSGGSGRVLVTTTSLIRLFLSRSVAGSGSTGWVTATITSAAPASYSRS